MICPNCKNESHGAKWCPECGLQLEIGDAQSDIFEKRDKGDTQKLRPVSVYSTEKKLSNESTAQRIDKKETKVSDKSFKILIVSALAIVILVLVAVFLIITGIIGPKSNNVHAPSNEIVLEKEDTDELFETAMEKFELGDYEEAETIFEAVVDSLSSD